MATREEDLPLQLSVLDRLIDDNPSSTVDPRRTRTQTLKDLRTAVRRDLEMLLNTRQRCRSTPEHLAEVNQSVVAYGLPDFATASMSGRDWRDSLRRAIERQVRLFEPRFVHVNVKVMDDGDGLERMIRFRIDALMHADPAPEPVVFDSMVEPSVQQFSVSDR
ncbi:MAG: type VI secretion system baseplate subunit TssE [Alphaproteobacteria bacterium]|nr:type VI secretion system baseplate subunit TssE [Alphaproteobacteria bacterium]